MINKVILIGNLGRDPETRRLDSGVAVSKFSVATNESFQDKNGEWQQQTEWHNIVCWRGLAERVENTLKKGHRVYLEGKLTTRKWQDKDGNDRYTTDIVARTLRTLERRDSEIGGSPDTGFPDVENTFPTVEKSVDQVSTSPSSDEDDLPF